MFTKPFKTTGFRRFFAQDGGPRRPKIDPRPIQDRLGSFFKTLDLLLRCWIIFCSVLVPIWPPKRPPRGAHELLVRPLGGVQDGLEIVLSRFPGRLVARDRFFGRLGVVWESFWLFFGTSTRRFNLSTHQFVDTTHQLINPIFVGSAAVSSQMF